MQHSKEAASDTAYSMPDACTLDMCPVSLTLRNRLTAHGSVRSWVRLPISVASLELLIYTSRLHRFIGLRARQEVWLRQGPNRMLLLVR